MAFFPIIATLILALLFYPILNGALQIYQHYVEARKIGLPILITPFGHLSTVWGLTGRFFTPLIKFIDSWCPIPIFSWIRYTAFGWYFHARYKLHAKYGPAFLIVSPGETQLIISDPAASDNILHRIRDFPKPPRMYEPLSHFGPNVDTVNQPLWSRHRRITTPPFNERISASVWHESLSQASGMLSSWLNRAKKSGLEGNEGVANVNADTTTLALHVLTAVEFGKWYAFEGGVGEVGVGHRMSYRDALKKVLGNLFGVILTMSFLPRNLPRWVIPGPVQRIQEAVGEFKAYMREMVQEEREAIESGRQGKDNLMSVLLRAADAEKDGNGRSGLSDEEIYGNLFFYNLAGQDTSANTLAYAITMLATNPKWQEWIGEEITSVFAGKDNVEEWEYEDAFPKLKRCLALMYETLRVYGPVVFIPKYTDAPQPLTILEKPYLIPANTYIFISLPGIHSSPSWGSDALLFRPDRFLSASGEAIIPAAGTFIPWISGPRVCPGKKFSQVEFVAVIARLFWKYRVSPKMMMDECETLRQAQYRVRKGVEDSVLNIALSIRDPGSIRLVWEEKK